MEQSAYEALMIGVYVFVFIVALTAGILLMSNIIDMVNYANEQAIVGMNGTLAETVGVVNERLYTGAQLVTYYRQELEIESRYTEEIESLEKKELDYTFTVKLSERGEEKSLKSFITSTNVKNYLNEKFVLRYKGENDGKHEYVFVKYEE